jgi:hypothetical protein
MLDYLKISIFYKNFIDFLLNFLLNIMISLSQIMIKPELSKYLNEFVIFISNFYNY